jgi:hypothetical protein
MIAPPTAAPIAGSFGPDVSLLLHIGFHKTGTSWLQAHAFGSKAVGFASAGSEERIKRWIVAPHDLDFDPEACRIAFAERIEQIESRGLAPVLSAERLCGDMPFGSYDSAQLAERLAASWPGSRVLIVIREQRAVILSSYRQYVKVGGQARLEEVLRPPDSKHPHAAPYLLLHFEYDRLIRRYHALFGEASVLVLPFELFRREPQDFVRRLVEFAGATPQPGAIEALPFGHVVNTAWPPAALFAKRWANFLLRGRINPWSPVDAKRGAGRRLNHALLGVGRSRPARAHEWIDHRMQATIVEAVADRYRESNARTAALTGLDLAALGYEVAAAAAATATVSRARRGPAEPASARVPRGRP